MPARHVLVGREVDIIPSLEGAAFAGIGADAVGCGLAGVKPGRRRRSVERFPLGVGLDELLEGERVRVVRWPRSPAAVVYEDGAELGQFEDGRVDPAAFEEWRFAEERDRQGGERDDFAGSEFFGTDAALEFVLKLAGGPCPRRVEILVSDLVRLVYLVGPMDDGTGIAEGGPGLDLVGERGVDRGGGLGIERNGKSQEAADS